MSVPRSYSVPHFTTVSLQGTKKATEDTGHHTRPKLPRHRSAVAISSSKNLTSIYSPRVEKEDPFSLSGFFPANLVALEHSAAEQEWDWLRASSDEEGEYRPDLVSPVSESEDEWNLPTPCSQDAADAFTREAIKREDKLGILALSSGMSFRLTVVRFRPVLRTFECSFPAPLVDVLRALDTFLRPRGDELYVEAEEHALLSPFARAGDPLDADAVVDALRALRTAYSLPSGSAVKDESAALHELFSPEKESEDKVKVETGGWGALVSWGVSRVEDYFSPVVSD